ncbi:MAG: archease [Sedimentisphaerales bacterium]|nr:archease [Sedimentisphaerales bacterium]
MPYEYLDDIARGDVAFEATGGSVEEMFEAAATATMNVMVGDLNSIAEKEQVVLSLDENSIEMLLFQFLQELIFYKDARSLLLKVKEISIREEGNSYHLQSTAVGETADPEKHELVVDVKAVTMHHYEVEKTLRGWRAQVILDI